VRGDFGVSFARLNFATNFGSSTNTSIVTVADQIKPRFINTLFLAGVAAAIAVPLSLTIGILAALFRNSVFDRVSNVLTLTSISSPEFFVAYILILFLAVLNPWLPSLSNIYETMEFGARLKATLLPALVLTLVVTAHMMRMTRAAIINLLASPYIINVIALNLAYLVTGVVVVEVVFVYPGVGQLFVDSVKIRDIPLVQACCLIFAAAYVLLNLLADIMSIISNPRLRHPK